MTPLADDADTCVNNNNGATDNNGWTCEEYEQNEFNCAFAGLYTDDDFDATQMCCACGGGHTGPVVCANTADEATDN
jgi:hypothetical protein